MTVILQLIHELNTTEGYYRGAKLFQTDDGNIYGSLDEGGLNGLGSILKIDTSNDNVSFPFHFSQSTGNTTLRSSIIEVDMNLSAPNMTDEKFELFPNPTNDVVEIRGKEIIKLVVSSLNGKQVPASYTQNKIDVSELRPGIYVLKIYTESGIITKKLIKN